jgi:hypothetical protein
MTALGRMPLSAVLAGVDDDMVAASMTLLGSAKGAGNRPFARLGAIGGSGYPLLGSTDALGGMGLTPTPGMASAFDAATGFLDLSTPLARGGAGGGGGGGGAGEFPVGA